MKDEFTNTNPGAVDGSLAISRPKETTSARRGAEAPSFPVVGIGASAGGLEALEELFRTMPPETGMAFVVVSHQSPGHTSLLPELIGKCTELKPVLATHGMRVERDYIYVNPPGHNLAIIDGALQLTEPGPRGSGHLPIDFFFRSLAQERKENAICIVLSGTATDGTVGLRDVKAESGLVMVQDPATAKYSGMPASAIATRLVDYILPPENMAAVLIAYAESVRRRTFHPSIASDIIAPEHLDEILAVLRRTSGHDFTLYKRNMVERRVLRRMIVTHENTPEEYVRFLEAHPLEAGLLMKELLISVTSFFRDPVAFEVLAQSSLPRLLEAKPAGTSLRAWCPGCATGEEVYSLSILLTETMEKLDKRFNVQIFGTDLDSEAIDVARRGEYPAGITLDVSPQRLERFFVVHKESYCVKKEIRERVTFAVQDLIKDPPFTKIDIIFCRNLLIYMDNALQKRVLSMFHYALSPGGLLFLGGSEALNGFDNLFRVVDKKWRIFSRAEGVPTYSLPSYPFVSVNPQISNAHLSMSSERQPRQEISTLAEKLLAGRYAPASAIVGERGDIFYIHGKTGAFLEPAAGKQPNNNIFSMAREGLKFPLTSVIRRAASGEGEVAQEDVRVKNNGDSTLITISARKIESPESLRGLLLVTFQMQKEHVPSTTTAESAVASDSPLSGQSDRSESMMNVERELQFARESLQSNIEELQTSNEELQSVNEELQSSNEELETSREELQSLNEELHTVNRELESKVEQLSRSKDDMQNLLDGIDIATIFLDRNLRIRRFTRPATNLIRMIDSDIGRPIGDLASNLNYENLVADAEEVLRTLIPREVEVAAKDGSWCLMRILPYRSSENAIEGLVMTFVNITRLKRAEEREAISASQSTARENL